MNVAVVALGCSAGVEGRPVRLSLHICTDTGREVGADIPFDFAASATTMNNRIIDRAKQVMADQGAPVVQGDKVVLIGGVV